MTRIILAILTLGVALDLSSWIAWAQPSTANALAIIWFLAIAVAAFACAELAVAAVLLELLWGSHGHLLALSAFGGVLPLREIVFLTVIAATLWRLRNAATRDALWHTLRTHPARWPGVAFLLTLTLAAILGILRHPFHQWFTDANAWGFVALAPAFILAALSKRRPANVSAAPHEMQNAECRMQNGPIPDPFIIHHLSFIILI
ncbi:hypothetical protein HY480_00750, partial [Candidatus Uhrbacteria bacterium]|nr:hypothetical protein [Candidatus Uhrbacteria bacterium]